MPHTVTRETKDSGTRSPLVVTCTTVRGDAGTEHPELSRRVHPGVASTPGASERRSDTHPRDAVDSPPPSDGAASCTGSKRSRVTEPGSLVTVIGAARPRVAPANSLVIGAGAVRALSWAVSASPERRLPSVSSQDVRASAGSPVGALICTGTAPDVAGSRRSTTTSASDPSSASHTVDHHRAVPADGGGEDLAVRQLSEQHECEIAGAALRRSARDPRGHRWHTPGSSGRRPGRPAVSNGRPCAPHRAQPLSSRSRRSTALGHGCVRSRWCRDRRSVPSPRSTAADRVRQRRRSHPTISPGVIPKCGGRKILDRGVRDRGCWSRAVP